MSRRRWILLISGVLLATALRTVFAQTLTLRQAIDRALERSPQAASSHAALQQAVANTSLAKTALLSQVNFFEDISRGNDPVYVFGARLRQQQFTQADFSLNSLNRPVPVNNFATRFTASGASLTGGRWRTESMPCNWAPGARKR